MADTKIYYKYNAPGKLYFRRTSASGYTEVTLINNSNDFYIWNGPYDSEDVIIPEYVYIEEEIYPIFLTNFFREMTSLKNIYNIENLKTGECTKMDYMFRGSLYLTSLDLSGFDTSKVTTMKNMFYGCRALASLDVSSFDTSNVTDMEAMFLYCMSLTQLDLSSFDTSNVTNMKQMFNSCSSLTSLDVSVFNTSNVKDMSYMFSYSTSLISLNVTGFDDIPKGTNMSFMFAGCTSLTSLDLSEFDTSNVKNMSHMFDYCISLTSLDLSGFDTSKVTRMESMFVLCRSLTSLDISGFNTSNVTRMQSMFSGCRSLASLDVSGFNTSNVADMSYMFYNCNSLASLNLSSFDTSNVTEMEDMFYGCSSLISLDLSSFDTSNVTDMSFMFYDCNSLASLDVTSFDTFNVTNMLSMFSNCNSLASLDVSNFNLPSTGDISYMFGGSFLGRTIYFPLEIRNENAKRFFNINNNQHYLFNKGSSTTTSVINFWKNVASEYSNVHYEFDDNPIPTVSEFSVLRVDSNGSKTYSQQGNYAYLKIKASIFSTYLPEGYTNSFKSLNTLINGSIPITTLSWELNQTTNFYECWILIDGNSYTFSVSVSDSIKENNIEVESKTSIALIYTLAKAFTLVDYYHSNQTGTEGIAFGKFATEANLFDVDMPSRFRDSVIIDRLIGEIKMYAGLVIPNGWLLCDGSEILISDYQLLYAAIGDTWGVASDNDHFILPNFVGRMPLGASDINTTEWITITGENEYSSFTLNAPTYARWGTGTTWVYKTLDPGEYFPTYTNMNTLFGSDPASGVAKCLQVALNVASNGGYSWWRPSVNDMPTHLHSQPSHSHFSGLYTVPDRFGAGSRDAAGAYTGYSGQVAINTGGAAPNTNNAGGGRYISQMPPFAVINYIICAA